MYKCNGHENKYCHCICENESISNFQFSENVNGVRNENYVQ